MGRVAGGEYSPSEELFVTDILGGLDERIGSGNDLMGAAGRRVESDREKPMFYQACGTEDFLYESNQNFVNAYGKELAITYEEGPGANTWAFWDQYIQRVLDWLPIR